MYLTKIFFKILNTESTLMLFLTLSTYLLIPMDANKIKEPQTSFSIHPLLFKRWSPRAFSDTPVEPDKLQRIFEASRWSPSASNTQPWSFLLGFKGDEVYTRIYDCLVEFNQLWTITAPILMLALAKKTNHKGEPNAYASYDLGQAVAHLTFQATADELYVHQMAGFDKEAITRSLDIPGDYEVRTVIALGYRGDPEVLHPNLKKLEYTERNRKSLEEVVFTGKFGNKASFI
jgi:nitroreductase